MHRLDGLTSAQEKGEHLSFRKARAIDLVSEISKERKQIKNRISLPPSSIPEHTRDSQKVFALSE